MLSLGISLFAFDFSGSGHSDGEYVSLGMYRVEEYGRRVQKYRGGASRRVQEVGQGRSSCEKSQRSAVTEECIHRGWVGVQRKSRREYREAVQKCST